VAVGDDRTPRRWLIVTSLGLLVVALAQRPGEIVSLTRLERVLDPLTAIDHGLSLWNPWGDMGAVQWQTTGFLFNFDLPFVLTGLVGVPDWIAQRLMMGAILAAALWGFVRLVDALGIGRPLSRLAGGLVWALSPLVLSRLGWRTPEALAPALLPWVLVPLVRGAVGGSTRRAAARSALVIAVVGGANAAVTLALLPAPLIWLLTRQRGARRASLFRWWLLCTPMALAWWSAGLVLLGRYGADLLVISEPVEATTSPATLFNALRGSADWLITLGGGSYLPAASSVALWLLPVLGTTVLIAAGLAGLVHPHLPERRFSVTLLGGGLLALGAASAGWLGGPLEGVHIALLEGPLRAFRNVYKFQALVSLPVVLGLTHALTLAAGFVASRSASGRSRLLRPPASVWLVPASAVVALALAATPAWSGLLTRPGFDELPSAWVQALSYLDEKADGRVLVLPGLPEANYEWGLPSQIPLEWGADVRWATRNQVPMSGAAAAAMLDAVELAVERGGDPRLPAFLARSGFSHVLVPNDSLWFGVGAPAPERVADAMERSGLAPVAGFGELGYGFGDLHQLEVYGISGSARVKGYAAASAAWLSGDVEGVLRVPADQFGERAYVLTRDPVPDDLALRNWVVTDTNPRVATFFGLNRNNRSYVLGPEETDVNGTPVDAQRYWADAVGEQTVADTDGVASIRASSVGLGPVVFGLPAAQPGNALDGDPDTSWRPRRLAFTGRDVWGGEDQWLEVTFQSPQVVAPLEIELDIGPFLQRVPVRVTTTTDAGSMTSDLQPLEDPQQLPVSKGPTSRLRITIDSVSYLDGGDVIGIAELRLPGGPVERRLRVPSPLADEFGAPGATTPAWVFTRNAGSTSVVSIDTEPALRRVFTVPRAARVEVRAEGAATDRSALVETLGRTDTLTVTAESTFGNGPRFAPRHLVDRDPTTVWRPNEKLGERATSAPVTLAWDGPRTVDRLRFDLGDGFARPDLVVVAGSGQLRLVAPAPDGTVAFEPLTGSELTIVLVYRGLTDDELKDGDIITAVGLDGLEVPALSDLYPPALDGVAPVAIGCDDGPALETTAGRIRYSVITSLDELRDGDRLGLLPCDAPALDLPAGTVVLSATPGPWGVTIEQVVLGAPPLLSTEVAPARQLTVVDWGSTSRAVDLAGGEATLVVTDEVANEGWVASLEGVPVGALVVDGWRQAFLVPAGPAGRLDITYTPQRAFLIGTALGLALLVLLVVLAVVPERRATAPLDAAATGVWPAWLGWVVAGVIAVATTGVGALVLVPLWLLHRRSVRDGRQSWLPLLAAGSFGVAGVAFVLGRSFDSGPWWESGGIVVVPAAALTLLTVLCAFVTDTSPDAGPDAAGPVGPDAGGSGRSDTGG
jgi:arabinofuranan 3-O-arabinosyltransferase